MEGNLICFTAVIQKQSDLSTLVNELKITYTNNNHIYTHGESDIPNVQLTIKLFIAPPYTYVF